MFGNYKEERVKDTKYRGEYAQGIEAFLKAQQQSAKKAREQFFTPENYKKDPESYRKLYRETLGFPLTERAQTPKLLEKNFVARDGDVDIYRMRFQFFDCVPFYGIYFQQVKNPSDAPFVFGFHGGAGTPEMISGMEGNTWNYNNLVRRIIERGANVFAPQFLLWKQKDYGNDYNRVYTDGKIRQLGGSMTALELYFLQGTLEYFIENEKINSKKIGVAGLSYGGMYALHFAALDERIKACYSCSWLSDAFTNSSADWSYKNAQKTVSEQETAALVCPRALVVAMGDQDELFDWKQTEKSGERVKEFYRAFGKEEKFKVCIFGGTHEADNSEEEIEFLLANLK